MINFNQSLLSEVNSEVRVIHDIYHRCMLQTWSRVLFKLLKDLRLLTHGESAVRSLVHLCHTVLTIHRYIWILKL